MIVSTCRSCPDTVREDIAQEATLKVLQSLDQLRDNAALAPWVRTIARREIAGWARRQSREQRALGAWQRELDLDRTDGVAGREDAKTSRYRPADVRRAVHQLPPSQRELIYDHYVLGMSYAEASGQREIPATALKSRLHRARRRIEKELSMSQPTPSIALDAIDLDAIARAATFRAANDEKRPALEGVLLDNAGFAVATDGHRLLVAEAPGLATLDEPLLVRTSPAPVTADGASATVHLDELRLAFADDEIAWPLLRADFPDYRTVLPDKPKIRATVSNSDLTDALDAIANHLEAAHPAIDGFRYLPAIYLDLDARSTSLTLGTSNTLGYFASSDDLPTRPPTPLDWHFNVVVACRQFAGFSESFRMKVNAHYLHAALATLGTNVTLSFTRAEQSLGLRAGRDQAVIMPIA